MRAADGGEVWTVENSFNPEMMGEGVSCMADLGKGPLTLKVYRSRSLNRKQRYRWTLIAANGRKIANSGEGYAERTDAQDMGEYIVKEAHPNARLTVV